MRWVGKIGTLLAAMLCILALPAFAQHPKTAVLKGTVTDAKGGDPIPGAVIRLDENYLWAVTDADGRYILENVQAGTYELEVACLGYVSHKEKLTVSVNRDKLDFVLRVNSLALDEVVVTASKSEDAAGTTRTLGRNALDHLQMTGVSDIAALLPGGKTINPDLTAESQLALRGGGNLAGNAAFGTAVEVDGVRMGRNASARRLGVMYNDKDDNKNDMSGVDISSLGVENIESIEVVTGVPSAEYGDLNSGLVRVITRKGRTPLRVTMSVNPRTYMASVSKGVELGDRGGVLNMSGEWARATAKLSSPYKAYTRRNFTFDYSNTFHKTLRLEAGITGNIGGMNSESDPDLFKDEYEKVRDNVLTPHFKLVWLLNKSWVTNVSLDGSIYFHDERKHIHAYRSTASSLPAVHMEQEGYFLADALPPTYYSDEIIDSKELDYNASLKYDWFRHFGRFKNVLKAGVQWKATGNVGKGEYYEDPALAAHEFRPRPYADFPYMHNLSVYAEERLTVPVGKTELDLKPGLRLEKVMISGAVYDHMTTLSPRLNAKWKISKKFSIHGGWGVTEKLPSFYILYPEEEYLDILTFGVSYPDGRSGYVYYTQPYYPPTNPDLRWQRNTNTEIGLDATVLGTKVSLSLWRNVTHDPYKFGKTFVPVSYVTMAVPAGFTPASDPAPVVDHQTGQVWMRDAEGYRVPMDVQRNGRTFSGADMQMNGSPVERSGVELTADFPEIRSIRTHLRLDASYTHMENVEETLFSHYNKTMVNGAPYPYVGIYPGGNTISNGIRTDNLDANLTAITHIPAARLVITCRLEASLLRRSQRLSQYQGKELAIRQENGYRVLWPVLWMDLDGKTHPFTDTERNDPAFSLLRLQSNNIYTFDADGYDPYFSANLSITKEIGEHVSFSFFANNFTNARPYVKSYATGVAAIFTPDFYYGLTCRIKL